MLPLTSFTWTRVECGCGEGRRHVPRVRLDYIAWSILGMIGYSLVTLLVKRATRSGQFSIFFVLAIATVIVSASALSIAALRGDARALVAGYFASSSAWLMRLGLYLARWYRYFVPCRCGRRAWSCRSMARSSWAERVILGTVFLNEPPNLRKRLPIALATMSIFLIAAGTTGR